MKHNFREFELGYSDYQLTNLSKNRPYRNGFSVWATWESERTSFGKTFRKQIKYPNFLPLFFSSDHYVDMLISFRENEANPTYPLYFTWNRAKCRILREVYSVNAVHVEHPWIPYRRKKFNVRNKDAKGTLLFWPHSSENLRMWLDIEEVKDVLSKIPERYRPISICLSAHDIKLGLLPEIRKLNLPIFTVGNVQDQRFVDRFYGLVNRFEFAAGFYPGSHIYYLHEFGIPYLALDYSLVTMSSHGSSSMADGDFDLLAKDYPDVKQREIFDDWYKQMQTFSEAVTSEQEAFALEQLGCNSVTSKRKIQRLVYFALFKNILRIPRIYITYFKHFIATKRNKSRKKPKTLLVRSNSDKSTRINKSK